jgi:hypothetical protein
MSKKVLVAIIVFVVIVGGALLATKLKSKVGYENEQVIADTQSEKLYKDSDNDGLRDWEEELWHTNPNNPDTNGDGLTDFQDIRAGINPIGTSTADLLSTTTIATKVNPSIESDLTETDKFSRELFARYTAAKQSGSYATTTDYTNFFLDYINNNERGGDIAIYKESDFKSVAETSESLRAYGNALGKAIINGNRKFPGNELQIFDDAIAANDSKKLDALSNPISRYNSIRDEMLVMEVPEGILPIHAKMVNLFNIMITGIENMKLVLSDPVKAINGISLYPNASGYLVTAVSELHNYFINQGVIFEKSEDGYSLTK